MVDSHDGFSGYHGTLESRFQSIQKKGFHPSTKDTEWLGNGIYFFDKFEDAAWWAKMQSNKSKNSNETAIVISSVISCNNEEHLDLDLPEDKKIFCELVEQAKSMLKKGNIDFKNSSEKRRCFFCNLIFQCYAIKAISCTFPSSPDKYGFPRYKKQHCVSDNESITIVSGKVV